MRVAGESLEKGDLAGAQKALQGAGDALDKLAKATDGFSSLGKAGQGLQRSLEELVGGGKGGDGKTGAGDESGASGAGAGEGKTGAGEKNGASGAGKTGAGDKSGASGAGKTGAGDKSGASGAGKTGAGDKSGAGKAGAGAGKTGAGDTSGAGKAGSDPGGLIRDEGPAEGGAVEVQDLGGFRADFRPDGRKGGRPVSDLPPFAVRDQADRDDAVYLYEEKVGDYLSRENVPAEYREIIKKYFGLPESDESTRKSGDGS